MLYSKWFPKGQLIIIFINIQQYLRPITYLLFMNIVYYYYFTVVRVLAVSMDKYHSKLTTYLNQRQLSAHAKFSIAIQVSSETYSNFNAPLCFISKVLLC